MKRIPNVAADPGKADRVRAERERLMELFAGADENKIAFIRDAVQQVAWLGVSIHELQSEIDKRGSVVHYQNGQNQSGLQANPACKTLKDFQTLYNAQFRALLSVLPDKPAGMNKLEAFRLDIDLDDV